MGCTNSRARVQDIDPTRKTTLQELEKIKEENERLKSNQMLLSQNQLILGQIQDLGTTLKGLKTTINTMKQEHKQEKELLITENKNIKQKLKEISSNFKQEKTHLKVANSPQRSKIKKKSGLTDLLNNPIQLPIISRRFKKSIRLTSSKSSLISQHSSSKKNQFESIDESVTETETDSEKNR